MFVFLTMKKAKRRLEGFDIIYSRIPEISWAQLGWFLGASSTMIVSGQVQTASVMLNAKPERYRCRNQLDNLPDASFDNVAFASADNHCFNRPINWIEACPNATTPAEYHECAFKGSMLTELDTCEPCTEYVYSPNNTFTETVITQFNWVCDFSFFPNNSISTAIFMMGLLLGAVGFGYLSDRIGRKNGLMVASICSFITNGALFFANDPTSFTVLRFFAGAFGHASVIVSYVYVMEFLGPRGRSWLGCQHLQFFAFGYISLSLIAYVWRDWHYMQLAITARREILRVSSKTGGSIDERFIETFEEKIIANAEEDTAQHYSSLDLMRPKHMRRITFIMIYCWFVTSMIYYGLGLNAGSLSGDIFTNNAMYGVFDIFSKASSPFLINTKWLGRRGATSLMFLVGGVSCIGAMILNLYSGCDTTLLTTDCTPPLVNDQECHPLMKQASRWLAFVGKFAASALFALVYVYSGELYPTCVRASALGLCSAGGRIGGAISPLVFGLDDKMPWFSNTFFGVASLLASITTLFLPETYGKPLTQTIDEAEESYVKMKSRKNDILLGDGLTQF